MINNWCHRKIPTTLSYVRTLWHLELICFQVDASEKSSGQKITSGMLAWLVHTYRVDMTKVQSTTSKPCLYSQSLSGSSSSPFFVRTFASPALLTFPEETRS